MVSAGLRIAAYLRVSSDKQDVSRQRDSINRWAERNSPITAWFEDSEGRNSRDQAEKRKDFQRLMADVKAGRFDIVIVDSQDRFGTKDAFQWGTFVSQLRDNDCQLIDSSGRDLSADDDGTVLTTIVGALTSTREQREKAHRNVGGKIVRARRGEYQGGNPPYGFDVVCFGADGKEKWRTLYVGHYERWKVYPDGTREAFNGKGNSPRKDPTDTLYLRPTIELDRIKTLKKIFDWFATEYISPFQICKRLNNLRIDPVFGDAWHKVKLLQMLRNPVYIGFPTWNKRGGSRFAEFVDGQIQQVARGRKLGRQRAKVDFVSADERQFDPLIASKIWDRAQEKIKLESEKQLAVKKRPAQNDEVYLKPFLVCGDCGRPMRSTIGRSTRGLWPSYFCANYGDYGNKTKDPNGCHCNRVKHSALEPIIWDYMDKVAPKVKKLLGATNETDAETLLELQSAFNDSAQQFHNVGIWMDLFVRRVLGDDRVERCSRRHGISTAKMYEDLFNSMRAKLTEQVAAKERELDKMLNDYADLSGALRDRCRGKMETLQGEIDRLNGKLVSPLDSLDSIRAELRARDTALREARKTHSGPAKGSKKAEAIRGVIDHLVCRFRHTESKSGASKSYLESVDIHAVSGETLNVVTNGNTQGRD